VLSRWSKAFVSIRIAPDFSLVNKEIVPVNNSVLTVSTVPVEPTPRFIGVNGTGEPSPLSPRRLPAAWGKGGERLSTGTTMNCGVGSTSTEVFTARRNLHLPLPFTSPLSAKADGEGHRSTAQNYLQEEIFFRNCEKITHLSPGILRNIFAVTQFLHLFIPGNISPFIPPK